MKVKIHIFNKQTKKEVGSTKKKIEVAKCRKFMWKEKIAVKKGKSMTGSISIIQRSKCMRNKNFLK